VMCESLHTEFQADQAADNSTIDEPLESQRRQQIMTSPGLNGIMTSFPEIVLASATFCDALNHRCNSLELQRR